MPLRCRAADFIAEGSHVKRIAKRRRALFNKDPHCHWCGIEVVWYDKDGGTMPENGATIDHLRSRLNPERRRKADGEQTVLACSKCNQQRNRQEELALSPEELRARCSNHPAPDRFKKNTSEVSA